MREEPADRPTTPRPRPRLIAGVYNYCDAWCERCVFQTRCRVFQDRLRYQAAIAEGEEAVRRLHEREDDADEHEYEEDDSPVSPAEKAEFLDMIEEAANFTLSPKEQRRLEELDRKKRRLQARHPLTIAGRAYMNDVLDLRDPLKQVLSATSDPLVDAALEAITHHALLIGAKTRRASSGLVGSDDDDEEAEDVLGVQSDSNGCAKLLRLVIAESRDAWSLLMTVSPLATDGLPAAMIDRLEALDRQVQEHFPRAMEFLRPGFDGARRPGL